ncbi:hypothetical protein [Bradyrhizobium guangzhouense]|uniref:Uncharacterized protein n=1 Tax=Bradyrhizobium guangzhouense TaxID=1325095 RepID=A0AAE6C959_9BRAD|nr:hypothetical protein [Bradyrhizobium guangzhouense]QAU47185.1 hypothetical protein XH91_18725 [Bradyrhizobium guangzhouense]RXH09524.1 hypothetical protein EAS54_33575 [Bradyrhizobium guangzhouense]RXH13748.1 hypothetical protein EAS56_14250 [Bradyrhizobium guangzhouense]
MIFFRLSLKALAITVAAAAVAGAVLLAARPQPIESTVLGAAWECTQTAFILTSCAPRAQEAIPAVETLRREAVRQTKG